MEESRGTPPESFLYLIICSRHSYLASLQAPKIISEVQINVAFLTQCLVLKQMDCDQFSKLTEVCRPPLSSAEIMGTPPSLASFWKST